MQDLTLIGNTQVKFTFFRPGLGNLNASHTAHDVHIPGRGNPHFESVVELDRAVEEVNQEDKEGGRS